MHIYLLVSENTIHPPEIRGAPERKCRSKDGSFRWSTVPVEDLGPSAGGAAWEVQGHANFLGNFLGIFLGYDGNTDRFFFFGWGIFDWEKFWGRGYTSSLEVRGYTTAILRQLIDLGVKRLVKYHSARFNTQHLSFVESHNPLTWITSHKKELGFFVYFSSFLFDPRYPRSSQQPFCSWPWSGWIMDLTMVTKAKGYWSLPDCLLYSKGGCEHIPILLVISALLKQEDTGWLFTKGDCWLLLDCYQSLFYSPNPIGLAPKPPRNPTMDLE